MIEDPSLRQLRYFLALAETGHFRKAAERMGVRQPSLSVQIANLEGRLGVRLLERGRGPAALTPAGREVAARARLVVGAVRDITDLARAMQSGLTGTLRLGTTPTLGPYFLPHVVEALHRAHPDLELYVREGPPDRLRRELEEGMHDVILTQLPTAGADLVPLRLFREPLLLAVAADDPLAGRERLGADDLRGLRVLSLGPAYALHTQIAALCDDHGAVMRRDYEGTSLDALRLMVGMGMGAAFLPALYVRSELEAREGAVKTMPFRGRGFTRSIGLVRRRSTGAGGMILRLEAVMRAVAAERFAGIVTPEAEG